MMEQTKKKPRIEMRYIPPMTVDDDEAYLVREKFLLENRYPIKSVYEEVTPWKRMTRQQIEQEYPGAFEK